MTPFTVGDWLDRVLEFDVGPVAHGGHCVARVDGRVVFVRHALPGERVRAVVTEDRQAAYCRADAVTVLRASPDRVEPACAWARPGGCGGCDFQHVSPAAQRALKADVLAEQLSRLAGLDRRVPVEELPGGPLGWRTRVRLAIGPDGGAGLRPYRGHDVISIDGCPLTPVGMLDTVLARRWPPGRRDIEVALDDDGSSKVDEVTTQRVNGRSWRIGPRMFWQAHPALAETLCAVVRDWAALAPGGVAWDLYGGAGVLASVLAELVGLRGSVTVVECDRYAVAAGRAALADLPQVQWRTARVERVLLADSPELKGPPDLVVADPPRRGLGRAVVDALAAPRPAQLIYVGCDPASLARDIATFATHGYQLTELRAFDAFPMTHHLESVALLERPL
ncbi:MAG: class I SAM-dependent RNA methyltransferase [Pseudonocardia sp.]|nr:class I SAM-dependent RNA methyltransferase [Pseudonocardia sp.]